MPIMGLLSGLLSGKGFLVIGLAAFGVVVAGFLWYYSDTQKRLMTYAANQAVLELAVEEQRRAIGSLRDEVERGERARAAVRMELAAARSAVVETRKKFRGAVGTRDIGRLGAARPDLVEKAVNRGSAAVMRCFELLSGAAPTERERDAENVCPGPDSAVPGVP